jgi:hypothetical protein
MHDQGLSYAPDVRVTIPAEGGVLEASASVPQGRVGQAVRAMRGEIDRVRDDARVWSTASAFRGRAIQDMFEALETRSGLEAALVATVIGGRPLSVQAIEYESAPVSDLRAFFQATFAPGRTVVVVVGDRRTIEPQLGGLGAVALATVAP